MFAQMFAQTDRLRRPCQLLKKWNQSNHNPPTSGSSSDDLCFSVNEGMIWQRICSILQEAYPNWMPWTELHHTYEQLYQEAIPPWAWITMFSANLIQIRNTDGYQEIRWNQDERRDRSTSSTVSVTQEVDLAMGTAPGHGAR